MANSASKTNKHSSEDVDSTESANQSVDTSASKSVTDGAPQQHQHRQQTQPSITTAAATTTEAKELSKSSQGKVAADLPENSISLSKDTSNTPPEGGTGFRENTASSKEKSSAIGPAAVPVTNVFAVGESQQQQEKSKKSDGASSGPIIASPQSAGNERFREPPRADADAALARQGYGSEPQYKLEHPRPLKTLPFIATSKLSQQIRLDSQSVDEKELFKHPADGLAVSEQHQYRPSKVYEMRAPREGSVGNVIEDKVLKIVVATNTKQLRKQQKQASSLKILATSRRTQSPSSRSASAGKVAGGGGEKAVATSGVATNPPESASVKGTATKKVAGRLGHYFRWPGRVKSSKASRSLIEPIPPKASKVYKVPKALKTPKRSKSQSQRRDSQTKQTPITITVNTPAVTMLGANEAIQLSQTGVEDTASMASIATTGSKSSKAMAPLTPKLQSPELSSPTRSIKLPGKAIEGSTVPYSRRTLESTRRWHKNCLVVVSDASVGFIRHFCVFLMRRFIKYHQQCQQKDYTMAFLMITRKSTAELNKFQNNLPNNVYMHKCEISDFGDTRSFDTLARLLQKIAPGFSTMRDQVILVHGPGKLVTHIMNRPTSETNSNDLMTLQALFSDCVGSVIKLTTLFLKIFPMRTVNRKIVNINPSFKARQWPDVSSEYQDEKKDVNRVVKTRIMKGSSLMVTARAARDAFLTHIANEDETIWCISYDPSAYLLFSADYLTKEKIVRRPDMLREALRSILRSSLTRLLILIEEESLDSGTVYIFDEHWANDLNKYRNVL